MPEIKVRNVNGKLVGIDENGNQVPLEFEDTVHDSVNAEGATIADPDGSPRLGLKNIEFAGLNDGRAVKVTNETDLDTIHWIIANNNEVICAVETESGAPQEMFKVNGEDIILENDATDGNLNFQSENGGGFTFSTDAGDEFAQGRLDISGYEDGSSDIVFKNLDKVLVDGATVTIWEFGEGMKPWFSEGINMTTGGSDIVWTGGSTHEIRSNNTAGAEIQFEDRQNSRDWMRLPEGETPVFYSPNDVTADSVLDNSEWTAYLDETNDNLELKAQYSDGTVRTGTVSLS